jgi:hypothetical protein
LAECLAAGALGDEKLWLEASRLGYGVFLGRPPAPRGLSEQLLKLAVYLLPLDNQLFNAGYLGF